MEGNAEKDPMIAAEAEKFSLTQAAAKESEAKDFWEAQGAQAPEADFASAASRVETPSTQSGQPSVEQSASQLDGRTGVEAAEAAERVVREAQEQSLINQLNSETDPVRKAELSQQLIQIQTQDVKGSADRDIKTSSVEQLTQKVLEHQPIAGQASVDGRERGSVLSALEKGGNPDAKTVAFPELTEDARVADMGQSEAAEQGSLREAGVEINTEERDILQGDIDAGLDNIQRLTAEIQQTVDPDKRRLLIEERDREENDIYTLKQQLKETPKGSDADAKTRQEITDPAPKSAVIESLTVSDKRNEAPAGSSAEGSIPAATVEKSQVIAEAARRNIELQNWDQERFTVETPQTAVEAPKLPESGERGERQLERVTFELPGGGKLTAEGVSQEQLQSILQIIAQLNKAEKGAASVTTTVEAAVPGAREAAEASVEIPAEATGEALDKKAAETTERAQAKSAELAAKNPEGAFSLMKWLTDGMTGVKEWAKRGKENILFGAMLGRKAENILKNWPGVLRNLELNVEEVGNLQEVIQKRTERQGKLRGLMKELGATQKDKLAQERRSAKFEQDARGVIMQLTKVRPTLSPELQAQADRYLTQLNDLMTERSQIRKMEREQARAATKTPASATPASAALAAAPAAAIAA